MQCQKLKTYMETGRVVFLPAGRIRPNPAQPRKVFLEESLQELSESIRQHGVIQPLSVRRIGNSYELIAGERRLRAAKLAGLSEIPVTVIAADDKKASDLLLIDLTTLSEVCDYFLICTAGNRPQLDAIVEAIEEKVRLNCGQKPMAIEGKARSSWVLIDFGSVVCHVFLPETRDFYRLERLWGDAPRVSLGLEGEAQEDASSLEGEAQEDVE